MQVISYPESCVRHGRIVLVVGYCRYSYIDCDLEWFIANTTRGCLSFTLPALVVYHLEPVFSVPCGLSLLL